MSCRRGLARIVTSLPPRIENLVIGAGQAGLAMSWHLQRAGREHVVLERRSTLGGGWQDRWDGFRLVTPNWSASFPDELGLPIRDRGAARVPGLDFIGSLWQYDLGSAALVGLRRGAGVLAERMGLGLHQAGQSRVGPRLLRMDATVPAG